MVDAIDISPDHNRLYAGGRFTTLNNVAVGKVVALSQTNGALDSSFNPPLNTTKQPVEDVEALNTKVFVAFGGGYNRFVQFNAATGAQEYGSCGDGDVQEVHLVSDGAGGTVLLVGGHFAGNPKKNCTLDTIPTARIAEYRVDDTAGSLPVVVNPTPFSNVYANELGVWEFLGTSLTDIWVAGDFLKVSSRNTGGLAHFLDGSTYTDGQNPSTPTNVQVTAPTPGGFTVSWSASTDNKGVAGYYVVVDGVRRATSLGTTAVVSGLNPGVTTTVQVQAFDVKVNLSALSAGVPGTTLTDGVPPSAPTNLRVLNGSTSELVLGWNAAVDNGTVTEYQVYADGALLGTTSGLSLAHSNLTPGSQHTYQVTAKDAGGNVSPPSATLTARAYSVVLKAGPTTIWKYRDLGALPDFTWRDAAYDDSGWASGKAPLGYGKADITANGTTIGWGPNNSNRYLTSYARTTFTLADPTGITGMALKLRGTDGAAVFVNGRLAYNDNLPAALEPDLGALTARDTAALDVAREFRVPVSPGMLVAGTNVVAVEFHKYAPNATYLAFDTELSLGLAASNTPPPAPPTGVTATPIAGPKVQVGWDAVAGAASYVVLRNGTQIGTATSPGFTDTSPPSGTALSYTVRTVDDLGRTSSDSTAATVTITPPAAPANLTATVQSGPSVLLAWDAVGGASSYVVLRGGSPLATVPSPGYTDPLARHWHHHVHGPSGGRHRAAVRRLGAGLRDHQHAARRHHEAERARQAGRGGRLGDRHRGRVHLGGLDRQRRRDRLPDLPRRRRRGHLAHGVVHRDGAGAEHPLQVQGRGVRRRGQPVGQEHRPPAHHHRGDDRRRDQRVDPMELLDHPRRSRCDLEGPDLRGAGGLEDRRGAVRLRGRRRGDAARPRRQHEQHRDHHLVLPGHVRRAQPRRHHRSGRQPDQGRRRRGLRERGRGLPQQPARGCPHLHDEGVGRPRRDGREEPDHLHRPGERARPGDERDRRRAPQRRPDQRRRQLPADRHVQLTPAALGSSPGWSARPRPSWSQATTSGGPSAATRSW